MNADSENRQRRILVADDEEYIVRVVSFKLESAGYEVVEAIEDCHVGPRRDIDNQWASGGFGHDCGS